MYIIKIKIKCIKEILYMTLSNVYINIIVFEESNI